jgi:hypothetical protein
MVLKMDNLRKICDNPWKVINDGIFYTAQCLSTKYYATLRMSYRDKGKELTVEEVDVVRST